MAGELQPGFRGSRRELRSAGPTSRGISHQGTTAPSSRPRNRAPLPGNDILFQRLCPWRPCIRTTRELVKNADSRPQAGLRSLESLRRTGLHLEPHSPSCRVVPCSTQTGCPVRILLRKHGLRGPTTAHQLFEGISTLAAPLPSSPLSHPLPPTLSTSSSHQDPPRGSTQGSDLRVRRTGHHPSPRLPRNTSLTWIPGHHAPPGLPTPPSLPSPYLPVSQRPLDPGSSSPSSPLGT